MRTPALVDRDRRPVAEAILVGAGVGTGVLVVSRSMQIAAIWFGSWAVFRGLWNVLRARDRRKSSGHTDT